MNALLTLLLPRRHRWTDGHSMCSFLFESAVKAEINWKFIRYKGRGGLRFQVRYWKKDEDLWNICSHHYDETLNTVERVYSKSLGGAQAVCFIVTIACSGHMLIFKTLKFILIHQGIRIIDKSCKIWDSNRWNKLPCRWTE
jgi:hypothetical protein